MPDMSRHDIKESNESDGKNSSWPVVDSPDQTNAITLVNQEQEKTSGDNVTLIINETAGADAVPVNNLNFKDKGYDDEEDDADGDSNLNSKWEDTIKRLIAFKEKHGHCLVPNRFPEDPQLGSWVSTQRRQFKIFTLSTDQSTPMTAERARRLESIGFQWSTRDPRHVPWEKRYGELLEFVRRFGHSQVPIGWKENVQLSNWVSTQRQEYKLMQKGRTTRLTQERIDLLNKVNFVWEAQRGGPRRCRRATDSVPAKACPAQKSEKQQIQTPPNSSRGGRRSCKAGANSIGVINGSQSGQSDMTGQTSHNLKNQALQNRIMYSNGMFTGQTANAPDQSLATSHSSVLNSTPANSSKSQIALQLLDQPHSQRDFGFKSSGNSGVHAYFADRANTSVGTRNNPGQPSAAVDFAINGQNGFSSGGTLGGIQSLGVFGQPNHQVMSQPWNVFPTGAFQQTGHMGLGIFPIATPLPIAAAGYQLGMIPTSLVEGGADAILRHSMFATETNHKKKSKHQEKSKLKRRRKEEGLEDSEGSDGDNDDDSLD